MIITPCGWQKRFLETQMEGLTGHIVDAGFPFDRVQWGGLDYTLDNGGNPGWWVYEQTAYWLDGYIRCAILLNDREAIQKGSSMIENVFRNSKLIVVKIG